MIGIELITKERIRQIVEEEWTSDHDDEHVNSDLAAAASYYSCIQYSDNFALNNLFPINWNLRQAKREGDKYPSDKDLIKAGALIAAELDRRERLKNKENKDG